MQIALSATACVLGILGMAYAVLFRTGGNADREPQSAWRPPLLLIMTVIAVLGFAFTLPQTPPWTSGLTLGFGLLLGAGLGVFVAALNSPETDLWIPGPTVGALSSAAFACSLLLIAFRGYPTAAITGFGLGAAMAAFIASGTLRPALADGRVEGVQACRTIEAYGLASVVIACATRIAIERFSRSAGDPLADAYWALPALLTAVGAIAMMLVPTGSTSDDSLPHSFRSGLIAGLAAVVVTLILQYRGLGFLMWLLPLGGGVVFAFLSVWPGARAANNHRGLPISVPLGAFLLSVAFTGVVFRYLQGFGLGLTMSAVITMIAAWYTDRKRPALPTAAIAAGAAAAPIIMLINRVLVEQTGRGWRLDFSSQYDLFALFLGLTVGLLFSRHCLDSVENLMSVKAWKRFTFVSLIGRTLTLGVSITVITIAVAAVFGLRSVSAFHAGLIVSSLLWALQSAMSERNTGAWSESTPLMAVVFAALLSITVVPPLVDMDLTRTHRVLILAALAVAGLIALMARGPAESESGSEEAINETPAS